MHVGRLRLRQSRWVSSTLPLRVNYSLVFIYGENDVSCTNLRNKVTDVRKAEVVKTLREHFGHLGLGVSVCTNSYSWTLT